MRHRIARNQAITACACCGENDHAINIPINNGSSEVDICHACAKETLNAINNENYSDGYVEYVGDNHHEQ